MVVLPLQKFDGVNSKIKHPPSSRVWTSAFARQSASFALATTHSPDVLFNASRPTAVPPLHTLREPTTSAPRGATLSTHIEGYRPRLMPLVHGRKNPHSPVHLYNPSSSAFASSPPCGSRSDCELAHFVYKYALNECSFNRLRAKHDPPSR